MRKIKYIISLCLCLVLLFNSVSAFADSRFGYDISEHNGTVSFESFKDSGKDFLMIRLGYYNHLDKHFWENVRFADENGIDFGVYLYSYAYSQQEAIVEADFTLSVLKELSSESLDTFFTLPVAYDIEDASIVDNGLKKADITKNMTAYCDKIKSSGYVPMIYANQNWFLNYIDLNTVVNKGYKIWYAYWTENTDGFSGISIADSGVKADMWQYLGSDYALDENVIFDGESLISKWVVSGGQRSYFSCGKFVTGWEKIRGFWYYFNSDGIMLTDWQKISGKWYYLASNGVMKTGWLNQSGKWYYLTSSGDMVTGWQKLSGVWYYFTSGGVMQTGWQKISGKWYYFNSNGAMQTSWQKISGKWYYFASGGQMKTGWLKLSGKWYYLDSSGKMITGSRKIGSKTYRFNNSGVCLNP